MSDHKGMVNQVIPDAAVEAAAAVIALGEMEKTHYLMVARLALEAAAPHMLNPPPPISEGPSEGADAVTGFPRAAYRKRRMG